MTNSDYKNQTQAGYVLNGVKVDHKFIETATIEIMMTDEMEGGYQEVERSMVQIRAVVMCYDEDSRQWISQGSSSSSLSTVHVYHHVINGSFIIFGRDAEYRDVTINSIIGRHLRYNQATPTFHQWRDSNHEIYGLSFSSVEDADGFASAVCHALQTINSTHEQDFSSIGARSVQKHNAASASQQSPDQHDRCSVDEIYANHQTTNRDEESGQAKRRPPQPALWYEASPFAMLQLSSSMATNSSNVPFQRGVSIEAPSAAAAATAAHFHVSPPSPPPPSLASETKVVERDSGIDLPSSSNGIGSLESALKNIKLRKTQKNEEKEENKTGGPPLPPPPPQSNYALMTGSVGRSGTLPSPPSSSFTTGSIGRSACVPPPPKSYASTTGSIGRAGAPPAVPVKGGGGNVLSEMTLKLRERKAKVDESDGSTTTTTKEEKVKLPDLFLPNRDMKRLGSSRHSLTMASSDNFNLLSSSSVVAAAVAEADQSGSTDSDKCQANLPSSSSTTTAAAAADAITTSRPTTLANQDATIINTAVTISSSSSTSSFRVELDRMKNELLTEMKLELQKTKEEILNALRSN